MAGYDKRNQGYKNAPKPAVEAKAPYNFVGFDYTPIRRYASVDELPKHNKIDKNLLSGEIHVRLTAQTPICIGGEDDFVKSADGTYMIPGSSFRGLLRQNMQILGQGLMRPDEDFADRRLFYRSLADSADSLAKDRKKYYRDALDIALIRAVDPNGRPIVNPKTGRQKSYSMAKQILGGYLHRDGDNYYIVPANGNLRNISRKASVAAKWENMYADYVPVWYRMSGQSITDIREEETKGYLKGMLVSPGYMQNQNRLYLFPQEGTSNRINLTEEDVLDYAKDFELRENTLGGTRKNMDKKYWKLPEKGQCKPVFYCHYQGRVFFGMSQFLRIPYQHRFSEGLPESHNVQGLFLDYPYAVMGFAGDDGAFRSRISVGNLMLDGPGVSAERVPVVLGEPKPSFFPNYVKGGNDYNQEDFELNGYKQYWAKNAVPQSTDKENVGSFLYTLPASSTFSGTIRYRNLHPDELGLLLWCIQLDNDLRKGEFFHTIGKGKPYGYGRVKPEITAIHEVNVGSLYSGFSNGLTTYSDIKTRIAELVSAYDCKAVELLGETDEKASLRKHSHIRHFLIMKKTVVTNTADVSYQSLQNKEFANTTKALATVEELTKRWSDEKQRDSNQKKQASAPKPSSKKEPDDWRAKIAGWGNKN